MKKQEQVIEEVAQARYICMRVSRVGDRSFQPGEYLSVPPGTEVPIEFMPLLLEGSNGMVETGPHFFCLQECSRHGRTFKPGEIWDRYSFKEPAPEGLFAPVSDRDLYELFTVYHNIREYRLKE